MSKQKTVYSLVAIIALLLHPLMASLCVGLGAIPGPGGLVLPSLALMCSLFMNTFLLLSFLLAHVFPRAHSNCIFCIIPVFIVFLSLLSLGPFLIGLGMYTRGQFSYDSIHPLGEPISLGHFLASPQFDIAKVSQLDLVTNCTGLAILSQNKSTINHWAIPLLVNQTFTNGFLLTKGYSPQQDLLQELEFLRTIAMRKEVCTESQPEIVNATQFLQINYFPIPRDTDVQCVTPFDVDYLMYKSMALLVSGSVISLVGWLTAAAIAAIHVAISCAEEKQLAAAARNDSKPPV